MDQLVTLREVLRPNFNLSWNLLLALVPLVLSMLLFEDERTRGWFWWLGVGLFVAFLPNAPYALTDVIHLFERFDAEPDLPVWATVLLVIEFSVYILVCFQADRIPNAVATDERIRDRNAVLFQLDIVCYKRHERCTFGR
jgi:uncharacterized membrane protein